MFHTPFRWSLGQQERKRERVATLHHSASRGRGKGRAEIFCKTSHSSERKGRNSSPIRCYSPPASAKKRGEGERDIGSQHSSSLLSERD